MTDLKNKWEQFEKGLASLPRERASEALKSRIYESARAQSRVAPRRFLSLRPAVAILVFALMALTAAAAMVAVKVRASLKASAVHKVLPQSRPAEPVAAPVPVEPVPAPVEPVGPASENRSEKKLSSMGTDVHPPVTLPGQSDSLSAAGEKRPPTGVRAGEKAERQEEKDIRKQELMEKRIEKMEREKERRGRETNR